MLNIASISTIEGRKMPNGATGNLKKTLRDNGCSEKASDEIVKWYKK